jgi:2-amino-4-hydroxy-6-hydroxymethyldihydropteridine diphosphokinase
LGERVFLSLGSNLGDREGNLRNAFERLEDLLGNPRFSGIFQSAPLYVTDQPPFLNAAAEGVSELAPYELLRWIHEVEKTLGRDRRREIRMGPRPLDLDILLFGSLVINDAALTIPHPRLHERAFALIPLLELAPELRDPRTGRPFKEFLDALGDQGVYSYTGR